MRGDKLLISKEKSKSHTRAEGTYLRTNLERMTSLSKLGFGPHWGRCSCNHWIDETLAGLHEPELGYHSRSSRRSPSRVQASQSCRQVPRTNQGTAAHSRSRVGSVYLWRALGKWPLNLGLDGLWLLRIVCFGYAAGTGHHLMSLYTCSSHWLSRKTNKAWLHFESCLKKPKSMKAGSGMVVARALGMWEWGVAVQWV